MFFKSMKYFMYNFMMLLQVATSNRNIVKVNSPLSCSNEINKDCIHQDLEGSWRVCQIKKHNTRFNKFSVGNKCSFPFVIFFNPDIVIAPAYIKFSKSLSTLKLIADI